MLKWRRNPSASTHLICFPFYSAKDIETRLYNIKCVFNYEPRDDTPFARVLYDTAMIDRDFKKAQEERTKQELKLKAQQQMAAARNNSNIRRRAR